MSSKTNLFMTGVTGYVGGVVLEHFLEHPDAASFHIVALVRSAEKAEKLRTQFGVDAVVGSLTDLALTEKLASEADVVIGMADCDDVAAAQATLKGSKKRYEATGKQPIFIHTGGSGVVSTNSRGLNDDAELYDDMNAAQFDAIPASQMHRLVDLEIVKADKQGYVKTYIILPTTVYGISTGKLVKAGIANAHSIQIPLLMKIGLDRGQGGVVGEGKNTWPHVEIHELADLYTKLYDAILKDPSTGHGREGFYFGANGHYKWYDAAKAIAQALVDAGKGKFPEPTSLTPEELQKYTMVSDYLGSSDHCVANRSFSIGWAPKKTTEDFLASLKPELDSFIAEGFSSYFRW